jgi:anti-sigma factor RsiW
MATDDTMLMAYVDGELDPAGVAEVEAAMAADLAVARRVRQLRDATTALRAAFNEPMREPVPERLLAPLGALGPQRWGAGLFGRYAAMAAILAIAVLGGVALFANSGVELPYRLVAQQQDTWLNSITNYHQAYVRSAASEDRSLVDVGGEDLGYLEDWFGKRLKRSVRLPQLEPKGFRLQGGRLTFVESRQAAQFFYKAVDGPGVISLTIAQTKRRDAEWTRTQRAGLNVIYWRRNGYAYVFAGAVDYQALHGVASMLTEHEEKI